ncbi:arginase family protein [Microbacterium sp. C7(2022)]|uniref:arginase family protein n=1 Tax=Microbacterium sp. C7(2022) TaxID=2992759 RepID=UPI00237B5D80|nr:arginase family protein [Microbacterium sp. C7(2022)]MDE0547066.1 arginase family protein [Microbacterium sp. C7(2022)]
MATDIDATALPHDPLWPRAGGWPSVTPGAQYDAVLVGVPTWRTSLSPTQAHATPAAVRAALDRYSPALVSPGPHDLTHARAFADAGDIVDPDGDEGEARVRSRCADLAQRSGLVIAVGGDNSLTCPVALGVDAAGLITLDAHYDLRDGVSNGSPVRRLIEAGMDPRRIAQIGISDFANSAAYARRAQELGITVITVDDVRDRGIAAAVNTALAVAGAGRGGIHLDIDVDVCDRSVAPGCPASVPGGLAAWELRKLVRLIGSHTSVRSADIVEVDATADAADGRTVRLAALCILELLAGKALT